MSDLKNAVKFANEKWKPHPIEFWPNDAKPSDEMIESINTYVTEGLQPGHFLTAVLSCDVCEMVSRADMANRQCIPAYVVYMTNAIPSDCWGNKKRVNAWVEAHASRREAAEPKKAATAK